MKWLALAAALMVLSAACGASPRAVVQTTSSSPSPAASSFPADSPSASPSPTPAESTGPNPSPTGTPADCVAQISPPPTPSWPQYTDPTYKFSIAYPPAFEVISHVGPSNNVMRAIYEVVDKCLAQFPPGQVEMGVFSYDATSLTAWVQKHSDVDCAGPNTSAFIFGVSNMHAVTAAGRQGLSFDTKSSGCGGPGGSGQETVFLLSSTLVFAIDWWAAREGYSGAISAIESRMLGTFSG